MKTLEVQYSPSNSMNADILVYRSKWDSLPICIFDNISPGQTIECSPDYAYIFNSYTYIVVNYRRTNRRIRRRMGYNWEIRNGDCVGIFVTNCNSQIIGMRSYGCRDLSAVSWVDYEGLYCDASVLYEDNGNTDRNYAFINSESAFNDPLQIFENLDPYVRYSLIGIMVAFVILSFAACYICIAKKHVDAKFKLDQEPKGLDLKTAKSIHMNRSYSNVNKTQVDVDTVKQMHLSRKQRSNKSNKSRSRLKRLQLEQVGSGPDGFSDEDMDSGDEGDQELGVPELRENNVTSPMTPLTPQFYDEDDVNNILALATNPDKPNNNKQSHDKTKFPYPHRQGHHKDDTNTTITTPVSIDNQTEETTPESMNHRNEQKEEEQETTPETETHDHDERTEEEKLDEIFIPAKVTRKIHQPEIESPTTPDSPNSYHATTPESPNSRYQEATPDFMTQTQPASTPDSPMDSPINMATPRAVTPDFMQETSPDFADEATEQTQTAQTHFISNDDDNDTPLRKPAYGSQIDLDNIHLSTPIMNPFARGNRTRTRSDESSWYGMDCNDNFTLSTPLSLQAQHGGASQESSVMPTFISEPTPQFYDEEDLCNMVELIDKNELCVLDEEMLLETCDEAELEETKTKFSYIE